MLVSKKWIISLPNAAIYVKNGFKDGHYLTKKCIWCYILYTTQFFLAEYNKRNFRALQYHLHRVGGQIELGQGGVNQLGGRVVNIARCICF